MTQNSNEKEIQVYRSEFSRRTSCFASDGGQTVIHSVSGGSVAEDGQGKSADIQDTYRVIDSARRFLNQSSNAYIQVNKCNDKTPNQLHLRDMSKETLKLHSISLSHKTLENENKITQEAFPDATELKDPERSSQMALVEGEDGEPTLRKNTPDDYIDTAPSNRDDEELLHYDFCDRQRKRSRDTKIKMEAPRAFFRVEQNNSKINIVTTTDDYHSNQIYEAPLRSLRPLMPDKDQEDKYSYGVTQNLVKNDLNQTDQQSRDQPFTSVPISRTDMQLETDRPLFSPEQALDQEDIDANLDELQEAYEAQNIERSQLYDTGDISETIKSISKAGHSKSLNSIQNSMAIQGTSGSHVERKTPSLQAMQSSPSQQNDQECDRRTFLNKSHTQDLLSSKSLSFDNRHASQQTEPQLQFQKSHSNDKISRGICVTSEVKHQIEMRYDRIDLEQKLAEMTRAITQFKTTYGGDSPSQHSLSRHSQSRHSQSRHSQSQYSQSRTSVSNTRQTSISQLSRSRKTLSPPKQIQPRAGKPRALKIAQKKAVIQQAVKRQASVKEQCSFQVMNSSTEEHTFRPVDQKQSQGSRAYYKHDLPLLNSKNCHTNVSSHVNLAKEKNFYQVRDEKREQEYQEVMIKRDKQPYKEYAEELEERSRLEVRKTRFKESDDERHAHFTQPSPPLPQKVHKDFKREDLKTPKPQPMPILLTHESGYIDGRYFQALSPTSVSAALGGLVSGRTGQGSARFDNQGNLVSCLRSVKRNSTRDSNYSFVSPKHGFEEDRVRKIEDSRANSHQPVSRVTRPYSSTSGPENAKKIDQQGHNPNFKDLMSPPANQRRCQDLEQLQRENLGPPVHQFEHDVLMANNYEQRRSQERRVRNINGFEQVRQIYEQIEMHHTKLGAPLSTERSRTGHIQAPSHNTQRSMGIESYCQKNMRVKSAHGEQQEENERDVSKLQRPPKPINSSKEEPVFSKIAKIQEKSENLCEQLTKARRSRQEIEDNKNELLALKGENHNLKKQIEQKDLALCSLREQNGDQKKIIEELNAKVINLEKDVETVGDQQLFRKYKEVVQMKENFAQRLASVEFSIQSKAAGHDLLRQSYDGLKNSQIELVEMNKKLILTHQEETKRLEAHLSACEQEIQYKSEKLKRYGAIIKTFDAQIEMFEAFSKKSQQDIGTLQSQLALYKDLFQKEKYRKEELIQKLRPSQRPLHDSFKKNIDASKEIVAQKQQFDSNQDWERKVSAFQAFDSQKNSHLDGRSFMECRKSSSGNNTHTQLTQTMSKNLSFGHPLQFEYGSGQSLKNREYASAQIDSGRRTNPHQINLPLQILSESSSEGDKPTEETQMGGPRTQAKDYSFRPQHQDYPPIPRKQDTSMGRPQSHNAGAVEQDNSYIVDGCQYAQPENRQAYKTISDPAQSRQSTWNQRQRSISQPIEVSSSLNRGFNRENLSQNKHLTISNQQINNSVVLDVSNYSIQGSRVDKKKLGFIDDQESRGAQSSHINESAGTIANQAKLSFKISRPTSRASNNSQSLRKTAPQKSIDKSKLKPLNSSDYYNRLKQMQRRLDKARNDIPKNVSRSRSKSPVHVQPPQNQQQEQQQLPRQDGYQQLNRQSSSSTNGLSAPSTNGLSVMITHTSFTNATNRDSGDHSYQHIAYPTTTQSGNSAKSVDPVLPKHTGARPRSRQNGGAQHSSNKKTPLFYTSLYNGVQPICK